MEWILLSFLPLIENRGGIPVAIAQGVDPLFALIVSSFTSFLGGTLSYLLLGRVEPFVRKTPLKLLYEYFVDRVREKGRRYLEKYGRYALFFFVAVPLPGSGAYTGALFAYLFGMPFREVVIGLFAGTLTAGILVLTASVSLMALV